MFYGASTVKLDGKSAVGSLLKTARKYVKYYGDGAMIFLYGCGDRLASQLANAGVLALDCNSCLSSLGYNQTAIRANNLGNGLCLEALQDQQRRWCADADGNILM